MLRQPGLGCGLMSAAVVGQGDGELLRMFYAAVPDPDSAYIMTATSRDEDLLQRLRDAFPAPWSLELTAEQLAELLPVLEASAREYAAALASVDPPGLAALRALESRERDARAECFF